MIDTILKIFLNIYEWVISMFPPMGDSTFIPVDVPATASQLKGYIFMFDSILPVSLIWSLIALAITIEGIYLSYRFGHRIYLLIRGSH